MNSNLQIYACWQAKIKTLKTINFLSTVLYIYKNIIDIFLSNSTAQIFDQRNINYLALKLIDAKKPPYKLIYDQKLMKQERSRIYIKKNLNTHFIKSFKSY